MNDRIERLKSDAAELNLSKGAARDGLWQALGAVADGAPAWSLAFVAYQLSLNKDDPRDIDSLQILAVADAGAGRGRRRGVPALLARPLPALLAAAPALRGPGPHRPGGGGAGRTGRRGPGAWDVPAS